MLIIEMHFKNFAKTEKTLKTALTFLAYYCHISSYNKLKKPSPCHTSMAVMTRKLAMQDECCATSRELLHLSSLIFSPFPKWKA